MGGNNNVMRAKQLTVDCTTGEIATRLPDGIGFGSAHGRVIVSITINGKSTYAVLGDDEIDLGGHAFAEAVEIANRTSAPSLEVVQ